MKDVRDTASAAVLQEILEPAELEVLAKMIRVPDPEARANKECGLHMPWQHGGASLI